MRAITWQASRTRSSPSWSRRPARPTTRPRLASTAPAASSTRTTEGSPSSPATSSPPTRRTPQRAARPADPVLLADPARPSNDQRRRSPADLGHAAAHTEPRGPPDRGPGAEPRRRGGDPAGAHRAARPPGRFVHHIPVLLHAPEPDTNSGHPDRARDSHAQQRL